MSNVTIIDATAAELLTPTEDNIINNTAIYDFMRKLLCKATEIGAISNEILGLPIPSHNHERRKFSKNSRA